MDYEKKLKGSISSRPYQPAPCNEYAQNALASEQVDILEFARKQLKETEPRDDYRELPELSIVFLGVRFMALGDTHSTRRMAIKVPMFSRWGQFRCHGLSLHGSTLRDPTTGQSARRMRVGMCT